jgi:hypothetical protein
MTEPPDIRHGRFEVVRNAEELLADSLIEDGIRKNAEQLRRASRNGTSSAPGKSDDTPRPLPASLAEWLTHPELLQAPAAMVPLLLWQGRSTFLSGLPKAGKSTLAAQIAATLSVGGELFGQRLAAMSVLWFALDEFFGDAVRRLHDFGADPARVYIESERPSGVGELCSWCKELGVGLVIIDTATRWWLGRVKKSNDAEEVRAFLAPYLDAMRDLGVAVLILHHTSKAGLRASGSIALEAEPDVSLVLVHPSQRRLLNASGNDELDEDNAKPDDGKRIVQGTSRFSPHIRLALKFEGNRFALDAESTSRRDRILEAAGKPNGPFLKGELATQAGGKRQNTLELIDELRALGLLDENHGRYSLSAAGRAALDNTVDDAI